jgi:hypothetical protein
MKVVVLLAWFMGFGWFGVTECVTAPGMSFGFAGTMVGVRCDAIPSAAPAARSVAPEVAVVASLLADRGPDEWQKDRETIDRERQETLDSELGASND